MESGEIKDNQLFTSSFMNDNSKAGRGRLNLPEEGGKSGGWVANNQGGYQHFTIKIDSYFIVTGIATQGRDGADNWVKKYKLRYYYNGWHSYKEQGQITEKVNKYHNLSIKPSGGSRGGSPPPPFCFGPNPRPTGPGQRDTSFAKIIFKSGSPPLDLASLIRY